jgi:outer membrane immunogenic protein
MKRALFCAAALLAASSAQAADLPRRQAPVYAAPPMFTWTGFYLGLNAGIIGADFSKGARFIDGKPGFTGGVTAGYNHQISNIVLGVEGDYNYSGAGGRGPVPFVPLLVRGELNSFGTIRGRLGIAFDRALVYGTGGFAFGSTKIDGGLLGGSNTQSGYALGGGLEYAFTQNISAKAEYLYMPLSAKGSGLVGILAGTKAGIDANIVRAGVNYRF